MLSVGRWNNYVAALQPGFTLGPDKALEAVAPTTQVVDERTLDVLGASARVALPTTTVVSTTNVLPDGKPAADPGQTTTTSKTGDASGLALTPSTAGTRTAAGLVPLGKPDDATLGMEPMLRYWAATALYQEVQLINRYVRDAAVQETGYEAFVVRFQVGVMPRRRDLQFDAYANLSFFADDPSCQGAPPAAPAPTRCKTPIVLPLLAADSIEGALHSTTANQLRNYALALSGMLQGVGAVVNLDKLHETLDRIAGRDLNSLLMVSRLTQNTLRVRLGAAQQGNPRYAMVPQNRFVTAVVLIPKTYVAGGASPRRLLLESSSEMVDVRTGKALPRKPDESDARDVEVIVKGHDLCKEADVDKAWNAILDNDWWAFRAAVCAHPTKSVDEPSEDEPGKCATAKEPEACESDSVLHQIWRKVAGLEAGYGVDALQVELPNVELGTPPAQQQVLLTDDKKDATSGIVVGGSKLATETTCAALVLGTAPAQTIAAREVEVLAGGTQVRLAFPSLKRFKLDGLMVAAATPKLLLGTGETQTDCWATFTAVAPATVATGYGVVYTQVEPAEPPPGFTLKVLSGLVTSKAGKGALRLELSPDAAVGAASVLVALSGADVEQVKAVSRTAAGVVTPYPAFASVGADFLVPLLAGQTTLIDVALFNAKDGTELKIEARNPAAKVSVPGKTLKIVAAH